MTQARLQGKGEEEKGGVNGMNHLGKKQTTAVAAQTQPAPSALQFFQYFSSGCPSTEKKRILLLLEDCICKKSEFLIPVRVKALSLGKAAYAEKMHEWLCLNAMQFLEPFASAQQNALDLAGMAVVRHYLSTKTANKDAFVVVGLPDEAIPVQDALLFASCLGAEELSSIPKEAMQRAKEVSFKYLDAQLLMGYEQEPLLSDPYWKAKTADDFLLKILASSQHLLEILDQCLSKSLDNIDGAFGVILKERLSTTMRRMVGSEPKKHKNAPLPKPHPVSSREGVYNTIKYIYSGT